MKITANSSLYEALAPSMRKRVQASISNNLKRIVEGSSEVLVSPILGDTDDSEIANFIQEILHSYRDEIPETLLHMEESNLDKFGPRSLAKPWEERKDSLVDYFRHNVDSTYIDGFLNYAKSGGIGALRAADTDTVVKALVKNSSSGLPYMTRKGDIPESLLRVDEMNYGVWPCMLFTRTQEQGKTRNVWGYPVSDTMYEQRFLIPYMKYEKTLHHRSALNGPEAVDDAMFTLLARYCNDDNSIAFCVDFSSYDASIDPRDSAVAFAEIARSFQSSYHDEIREMAQRFITIPIVTPEGTFNGHHGVPSGSSFTNTIDSIVQLHASNFPVDGRDCQIQGDDGVYCCDGPDRVAELESSFKVHGLQLNVDKTFRGRRNLHGALEAIYLQRYFSSQKLGGIYPISRALNRIKYLERWTDFDRYGIEGSDFFSLRTIMILENCKHHPCFGDLVRYVQKSDKHGLQFNRSALPAYSKVDEARSRAGVTVEGDVSGIERFATVDLLSQL